MTESRTLISNFKKILKLERAKGYQDQAVFGGLQDFIEDLSKKISTCPSLNCPASLISNMEDLVDGYSCRSISERRKTVFELEDIQKALMVMEEEKTGEVTDQGFLDKPIRYAKGVGKEKAPYFKKLGIETIEDLLFYFPHRIEDRRRVKKIADLKESEKVTVKGSIQFVETMVPKDDLQITKIALRDRSGTIYGMWVDQPGSKAQFSEGEEVAIYGKVEKEIGRIQIKNPVAEPADQKLHTQRLVPIYRTTQGISTLFLRKVIWDNLDLYLGLVEEVLPKYIREGRAHLGRKKALKGLHFPKSFSDQKRSRFTLAYEESFIFQLGALRAKRRLLKNPSGKRLKVDGQIISNFLSSYPFKLTQVQQAAIEEITEDMASIKPMRRLLQGDVGAGKNIVASLSCLICCKAGYQATFLAPTQVLAERHYLNLKEELEGLKVEILNENLSQPEKEGVYRKVSSGEVDLLVGTYWLIQNEVTFDKLGLVVVYEQQGSASLGQWKLDKVGENVNILVTSQTPIAETLRLILYGGFDFSIIDQLPITRRVQTLWVSEGRRNQVYEFMLTKLNEGQQGYVIYPSIKESEGQDITTAAQGRRELAGGVLKDFGVRLISPQMSDSSKKELISKFRSGDIDVLVSTPQIDIRIDNPQVNLMIIEHADQFGLLHLHRLRGMIGRGGQKSYCFALATPDTEKAKVQLEAFRDMEDGFEIAEIDLKIRVPDKLLGLAFFDNIDTIFKVVDLTKHLNLMKAAHRKARKFLACRDQKGEHRPLMEEFARRYGEAFKSLTVRN